MTQFLIDISNNNRAVDLAAVKRQGFVGVSSKVTEGTGFVDGYYAGWRKQAQQVGLLFNGYHALHRGNAAAQADFFCAHLGGAKVGHLDFEPFGDNPQVADAHEFIARCATHGVRVGLLYHPHWYWQQIGSPALNFKAHLISSNYPLLGVHDHAASLYSRVGGDKGAGWASYGGMSPTFWQFTDNAKVDGHSGPIDASAFRGTLAELRALNVFEDFLPDPKPVAHTNITTARRALKRAAKNHPKPGNKVGDAARAALKALGDVR